MSGDDVQNLAIAALFALNCMQAWYSWRLNRGCCLLAYNHRALVEQVIKLERQTRQS